VLDFKQLFVMIVVEALSFALGGNIPPSLRRGGGGGGNGIGTVFEKFDDSDGSELKSSGGGGGRFSKSRESIVSSGNGSGALE